MPIRPAALLFCCLAVALAVPAAQAAVLPAPATGCASILPQAACTRLHPTLVSEYSEALAISPDGRSAYYVSGGPYIRTRSSTAQSSALIAVSRDPASGAMRQVGCFTEVARKGCTHARGIDTAWDADLSPDGRFLYVAGQQSRGVAIFRRNTQTGKLTQLPGRDGCLRARPKRFARERCRFLRRDFQSEAIAITPDGRTLYASGVAFRRNLRTGLLTPLDAQLRPANGVRPDNVLTLNGHGQFAFTPDSRTALERTGGQVHAYAVTASTGRMRAGSKVDGGAFGITADGTELVTYDKGKLQRFSVDSVTATLTPVGDPVAPCGGALPACDADAYEVVIPPDGRQVLVVTSSRVVAVARDPGTGALTPGPADGCVAASATPGCAVDARLSDAYGAYATADSQTLMVLISGGLLALGLR